MAFTPQPGGAIAFNLAGSYSPSPGDAIALNLGSSIPVPSVGASLSTGGIRVPYGAAVAAARSATNRWRDSGRMGISRQLGHNSANPIDWRHRAVWFSRGKLERHTASTWLRFDWWLDCAAKSPWNSQSDVDIVTRAPWEVAPDKDSEITAPYLAPPPLDNHQRNPWDYSIIPHDWHLRSGFTTPPKKHEHLMTQWGDQVYQQICYREYRPPSGGSLDFNLDEPVPGAISFNFDLFTYDQRCATRHPGGWRDTYPTVQVVEQGVRKNQILEVYIIMNTVTAVKLPERTPIELGDVRLSHDRDAWAWGLSATVLGDASINLIRPDVSGNKEIEISINGWLWEFVVEGYGRDKEFAGAAVRVNGRSKTAYLASPYKRPSFYEESAIRTAQQLAEQEVSLDGWSVLWNTVAWTVPAGGYNYSQKTPIQAVNMIAGAVGAKILPHRTDKVITINPAYPISPWNWAAATPDATLTKDVIKKLSEDWQPKPNINGVYVAGQNSGVSCFVKRVGSAGDQLAQQVVDQLITHQDAGRERGRNILSDSGMQEIIDAHLPLMPSGQEPGLFVSGELLEIDEGAGVTWKALVIGTAIDVKNTNDGLGINQVLTLERHHL